MKINRGFVLVGAVIAAAIGYYVYENQNGEALPEDIAYGNGRIEAVQIDISSKIAGRVDEIRVKEGDMVEPGQVVATIDRRALEAQLARARAEVAASIANVAATEAAQVQAEALLHLSEQELERTRALHDRDVASQELLDQRMSDQRVADANHRAAKAQVEAARRSVDAAQSVVDEILTNLDDTKLFTPAKGRILYRLAEPGEVIGAGGRLLTMVDLSDVYLEFFLPSSQVHRIAIGSEARIRLDVAPVVVPATVSFVSPVSQFTPRQVETADERDKLMFRVKVRIPEELVQQRVNLVKTGIRGVAYVRLASDQPPSPWPEFLETSLPIPVLDQ